MGAFDEVPRSPTVIPRGMLGRGIGEARRKVMLLILLGGIVVMSLIAFRRQDEIGSMIQTQKSHWSNVTEGYYDKMQSAEESAEEMSIPDPPDDGDRRLNETKTDTKTKTKTKTQTHGNEDSSAKQKEAKVSSTATEGWGPGPTMGERVLKDSNREQLRNETLGVSPWLERWKMRLSEADGMHSLARSTCSTWPAAQTNSTP